MSTESQPNRHSLQLDIVVARLSAQSQWRAAVRIGGREIVSAPAGDPTQAVQALCLKLGSGHENTDLAIESAMLGSIFFPTVPTQALGDGNGAKE